MRRPPKPADVRRVVVTRLRYLGDVVLTTPLLAALRREVPRARIEYVTDSRFAPVLDHHPHVDAVFPLEPDADLGAMWRLARRLEGADWWIDLFGNPRSALLAAMARPRFSVGPARGLRSRVFNARRERPAGDRSAILHHLDKLHPLVDEPFNPATAQPPHLVITDQERSRVRVEVLEGQLPYTLLHPGSKWPDKAWPRERWCHLATKLLERGLGPLWLVTPPGEEDVAAAIVSEVGDGLRQLPLLPLRDLMAVVALSRSYVGNDGGILHCAVALGTPCVGLFGPTEPDIWFPYERQGPFRVIHHDRETPDPQASRLVDLPVAEVEAALMDVLSLEPPATNRNVAP